MHRCGMLPEDYSSLAIHEGAGRKLLAAAVGRYRQDFADVRGLRRDLLQRVAEATSAQPLRVARKERARDGFVKYLFELHDGKTIEAVRIPVPCEAEGADTTAYEGKEKKYIVCVSSQAGCALACAFCATGELGFDRNLATHEIVGQVLPSATRPIAPFAASSSWGWASRSSTTTPS